MHLTPFSKSYADRLSPWTLFCPIQRQVCIGTSHLEKPPCGRWHVRSQHSFGVVSMTDWLLSCVSTYASQATLLLQGGSRIRVARLSATGPLLCWLKCTVIWLIWFLEQWVLNSLLLILDKSKMTHKDE